MRRCGWMLVFVLLLGVGVAPQALASSPPDHMDKAEMHRALDVLMHLKHHPYKLKDIDAERAMWLLRGLKHLSWAPYVDQDALFDLQLKITLHLLDVQVKRLSHIYNYSYYPWDYSYLKYASPYPHWEYGYMHGYGYPYGYHKHHGKPMDRGMGEEMDHEDMDEMDDMDMDDHDDAMGHGKREVHVVKVKEVHHHYGYGYGYPHMVKVKQMREMKGIHVKKVAFDSAAGCHMNQDGATRKHSRDRHIFVGPCQQVGYHTWVFNVWWV